MSLQILDRPRGVRKVGERKWTAQCPAHDDRNPSLSIHECDNGTWSIVMWAAITKRFSRPSA